MGGGSTLTVSLGTVKYLFFTTPLNGPKKTYYIPYRLRVRHIETFWTGEWGGGQICPHPAQTGLMRFLENCEKRALFLTHNGGWVFRSGSWGNFHQLGIYWVHKSGLKISIRKSAISSLSEWVLCVGGRLMAKVLIWYLWGITLLTSYVEGRWHLNLACRRPTDNFSRDPPM